MTVSGIGFQGNSLQAIRAQHAFQRVVKSNDGVRENVKAPQEEDVKVSISSRNLNKESFSINNSETKPKNPYIGEIKEFMSRYDITDIEEEDIQEALQYGTSLFADHTA